MAKNIAGRIALVIEYDGTNYAGWQYQANAETVQAKTEQALVCLFKQSVSVRAASRTDSGVHARGQVVALTLPRPFAPDKIASALNWYLPQDIRVVRAYPVPREFDPRTWARWKIYRYFICNRPHPPAVGNRYCWYLPKELDMERINRAAALCRGRHDFASFQAAGAVVKNTVRTIRHLHCRRSGQWVMLTYVGDGFLYNMVRIITGTLVEVGLGKLEPEAMAAIISARDRVAAGPTAPAQGLFLERVLYRPSLDSYSRL